MRLLYLNKIYTNADWGAENFLNTSLQELGIETICIDYAQNEFELANCLLALEEGFDAVLLQRGTGYRIPLQILRAIRRPRFLLLTELVARSRRQHYLLKSQLFDHIFLRSSTCIDHVIHKKWLPPENVSLLRSAIRPDFHHPMPGMDKDIDVLFVGALLPRRQIILAQLKQHFNVVVCSAFGKDMVELVNRAKVTLNIHAESFLDTETRVYEVLACKGFLVTEKLSTESPFTHETHLIEASNLSELIQLISYYLHHPEARERISGAGARMVLADHTYESQALTVADTLKRYIAKTPSTVPPLDHALLRRSAIDERASRFVQQLTYIPRRALYKTKELLGRIKAN